MNVDEMIRGTQDAMTVKRVYGDPIEKDGLTVIPAAKVMGGGGGGGDAENNAGGGFGVRARPAGAWVIKDGKVRWEPALPRALKRCREFDRCSGDDSHSAAGWSSGSSSGS